MDNVPETQDNLAPPVERERPGVSRSKHLRILAYVCLPLLLATVSAFFSYRLLSFGEETRVPRFMGRSQRDAEELASNGRIQVRVSGSVYHPEIPVGFVVEQSIAPGTQVKEGQIVPIVLSKGPSRTLIPDFSESTLEEARFLAVEKGLEVTRVSYTRHDTVPNGYIAAQNPPPGQQGSSFVMLLVSQGPYRIFVDVPDLIGRSHAEARERLTGLGLSLLYTGSGNTVVRQNPAPGTRLRRMDSVEVHLSNAAP